MSDWNLSDQEQRNEAAAEYVLGLLDSAGKARFEALLNVSHDAQADVRAWQEHLNVLNEDLEPEAPPARVWKAIKRETKPEGFFSNLRFWQGATVSMAFTVMFTAFVLFQGPHLSSNMDYVYVVPGKSSQPEWIVNASLNKNKVYVEAVQPESLPDGQVCELWLMVAGREPVSLGILPKMGVHEVNIKPEWKSALRNSPLVITLESPGGAPDGYNMGPVLTKGQWTPVNKSI